MTLKQVGKQTRRAEPFAGSPPAVTGGDTVWCRTAHDTWIRRRALDEPRFDHTMSAGRTVWLSVPTVSVGESDPGGPEYVNWPAEHVRPAGEEPSGTIEEGTVRRD